MKPPKTPFGSPITSFVNEIRRLKPIAAAASKAVPPSSSIRIPTEDAIQWVDVVTPKLQVISGRVVKLTRAPGGDIQTVEPVKPA